MHTLGNLSPTSSFTSAASGQTVASTAGKVRILVEESKPVYSAGILHVLESVPTFETVGMATSLQVLLPMVAELKPDIVLLDDSLIDQNTEYLQWILNAHPHTKVIAEVTSEEPALCLRVLSAGAHAVVPRHVAPAELVQCIHTVAKGSHYVSPTVLDWLIDDWQRKSRAAGEEATPTLPHFNARETRVISMALRGLTNRDIAANILTSEQTVKNTLSRVYRRLGVVNRKSLRRLCIDMRLPIIWTPAHRSVKNTRSLPQKT
jgi:DNA-binding NarL/FixJ family response regulator